MKVSGEVTFRWTSEDSSFPDGWGCSWQDWNVCRKSYHKYNICVMNECENPIRSTILAV